MCDLKSLIVICESYGVPWCIEEDEPVFVADVAFTEDQVCELYERACELDARDRGPDRMISSPEELPRDI